ncbi:MAG: DUF4321 domain-containing protein [Clostridium sp.]|nr:DUF4321 domain-containing protein [Clostridium sp.]
MIGKNSKYFIFLIVLGGLGGTVVGDLVGTRFDKLAFLKSAYTIGTYKPLILDLKIMSLTFGVNISINIMTIIGIILAILLSKKH